MSRIEPFNVEKTAAFLFENSESFPNSHYILLMQLLQKYYESSSNESEILSAIAKLPMPLQKKTLNCLLEKKPCSCSCNFQPRCASCSLCYLTVGTFFLIATVIFVIAYKKSGYSRLVPPPPHHSG